jgi:hypothetical protein
MALFGERAGDAALPDFRLEPLDASNSTIARLIFEHPPQARDLPASMVLKLCPDGHGFLGACEPDYYLRDYVGLKDAPLVTCYRALRSAAATADSAGHGYAIFLEDLCADYTSNKGITPTAGHAANLGTALGRLHAHSWGPDAAPEGPHDLEADFQKFMAHVSAGLDPVLDEMADALAPSARARLTSVFDEDTSRMLDRAMEGKGLALVHGDPNPTNVLTPLAAGGPRAPLYLIDRQPFAWSLRLWLGASDLIRAAVPYWSEDRRRALQATVLERYHRALLENGVRTYSRDDLQADWNFCTCMAAATAVEWGNDPDALKDMKWLWERQLKRALALLEDCDAGRE